MDDHLSQWQARRHATRAAEQRHQLLRQQWATRNRGVLVAAALALAAAVVVSRLVATSHPSLGWYTGLIAGALVATAVARRGSPPRWLERYRDGAIAQEQTAVELDQLAARGWFVRHDLHQSRARVDHLVVGPTGVFVISSVQLHGGVETRGDWLALTRTGSTWPEFRTDRFAAQAKARAAGITGVIENQGARAAWVTAVVAVWADFPQQVATGDRMHYVRGDSLISWIRDQPTRLRADEIRRIAAAVQPARPPAPTPGSPPTLDAPVTQRQHS